MTVFELIEKLKVFDPMKEVFLQEEIGSIYGDAPVVGVREEEGKVYLN